MEFKPNKHTQAMFNFAEARENVRLALLWLDKGQDDMAKEKMDAALSALMPMKDYILNNSEGARHV